MNDGNLPKAKIAPETLHKLVLDQIAQSAPTLEGLASDATLRFVFARLPASKGGNVSGVTNGNGYGGFEPYNPENRQNTTYSLEQLSKKGVIPQRVVDGNKLQCGYHQDYFPSDLPPNTTAALWFQIIKDN